jgi:NACHT domain
VNLAAASVLFLFPWAVALGRVHHHHLDSGAVGLAATFSLGLPALWLAVAGYLEARRPEQASKLTMAHIADQLAVAVGKQWNDEAAVRRLNDPYPLPVSWDAADASLTDSWDSMVKLATSGAGWPPPPPEGTWAAGLDDLAGKDRELVAVLARVPTRRLVVLGEPGAGKTMLMVRLVLDLLASRAEGGPVPILASVAAWDPAAQDLRSWLSAQLVIDHPALASPPPTGRKEPTQAAALLASGLILPVLDGLDEIPEAVRGPAISRINDALRPGEQVVVTCRTRQYRAAVRPQGGLEVTLRAAAAIRLRPLRPDAIRSYLCDDAAGPVTRARWDSVLAVLGTKAPTGQALRTPLMVGLARAIYNPRPGELAGALRDPAELCSPALAHRTAVESLLFDAFIPAAYRNDPRGRWRAQDAERWLVFLARHLERTIGSPDLAWWQLPVAVPGFATVAGTAVGGVVGTAVGTAVWVAVGVAFGFAFGAAVGVVVGFVVGFVAAVAVGSGAGVGAASGVVAASGAWAGAGATFRTGDEVAAEDVFRVAAWADRQARAGAPVGARVVARVVAGIIRSFALAVWPAYEIARIGLALRRRLPWRLKAFLADAHRRGVLRRAGAVYQFRHIELQHRLANRP